jgi:anti-sigma B factor antagonist
MKIAVVDQGNISILTLQGDFVIGPPEEAFEQAIRGVVERKMHGVIVDFEQVRLMDSTGIDALISAMTSCVNAGIRMKIASVSPRVRRLFEMTRLDTVLDINDSVQAAVSGFTG